MSFVALYSTIVSQFSLLNVRVVTHIYLINWLITYRNHPSQFFISHDLNMVPYVNWMVGEQLAVMKIALPNTVIDY